MQELMQYIRELREQRQAYEQFAQDRVPELFQDTEVRERRPPRPFVDSSFLFIRSFDGDNGNRPFANKVFWLSPDILASPVTSPAAYTQKLLVGHSYNLRCRVRNRGDRGAPSAKVEFWLTDPSLGFDTRFAEHLTLGRVPTAWVGAYETGEANTTWTVQPSQAGHKCLIARVFCFSPLELPVHDTWLDPTVDRHVGQLNLNIVQQGQPFMFQWIHAPNVRARVEITPLQREEMLALRHPIMAELTPARDFPRTGWGEMTGLDVADTDARDLNVDRTENGFMLMSFDPDTPDVGTLHELRREVKHVLEQAAVGETHTAHHRDLFRKFREMSGDARRTEFRMETPDLGLREGQAVAVHIRAVDAAEDLGDVLGGVTMVVVG
jgi:hypothetical protein